LSAYRELGGGPLEVVGVAGRVRRFGLEYEPEPTVYTRFESWTDATGVELLFVARTNGMADKLTGAAEDVVRSTRDDVTVRRVTTMEELVDRSIGGRGSNRVLLLTSIGFGVVALVLVGSGIYGVVSHTVAHRTREIGTHMALGAAPFRVTQLILWTTLRPVLWGVALGIATALAAGGVLRSLLFGVTPYDPLTYVMVLGVVGLVTALAMLVPSWTVLRTNPIEALRCE
jgi:hypothetical protein